LDSERVFLVALCFALVDGGESRLGGTSVSVPLVSVSLGEFVVDSVATIPVCDLER
jgi:hypothetical protein